MEGIVVESRAEATILVSGFSLIASTNVSLDVYAQINHFKAGLPIIRAQGFYRYHAGRPYCTDNTCLDADRPPEQVKGHRRLCIALPAINILNENFACREFVAYAYSINHGS